MITYNETAFLWKRNPGERITSEIKNFWNFNSHDLEVFLRKVKSKASSLKELGI
jgi:hypothetical protein